MPRTPRIVLFCALAAVVVSGAGCGREPATGDEAARGTAFPVTIAASNGSVVVPQRPGRIVSLSPTATEMLYAIGAGSQVVAVDDQSNYPPDAPKTKLSGFQPNAEAVAQRKPDLVVLANDINEIVNALRALKVPTLVEPAAETLADSYEQIKQLGTATGHASQARRVVASMSAQVAQITHETPKRSLAYYHELDQKLFSVTSNTFIGQMYALLGLRNIADAAKGAGTGYPQLSAEYVVQANPDIVFLADTKCCGQSAAKVRQRPGWSGIAAVRSGAVVELDDDVASRWGPRIVELVRIVAAQVAKAHPAQR